MTFQNAKEQALSILGAVTLLLIFTGCPALSQQSADKFQYPLNPYDVTGYGFAEVVGCTGYNPPRHHLGDDILADVGTPVKAIANGKVIYSGSIGGYGHAVVLEHQLPDDSSVTSTYGHLSKNGLIAGDRGFGTAGFVGVNELITVRKGEVIAYIGDRSENGDTVPHLHFQIRKGAAPKNSSGTAYVWRYYGYSRYGSNCASTAEDVDYGQADNFIGGKYTRPRYFIGPRHFNIGDSVRTTAPLNVRTCASTACSKAGPLRNANTTGSIIGGPATNDGYAWWEVHYEDGVEGWSSDHRLEETLYDEVTTTFTADWNLFSVPIDPTNHDPVAVLCDDLSPCYTVWRWNPTTNAWDKNPPIDPGNAYWIWVDQDTIVDAQGSLLGGPGLVTGLVNGSNAWNMIGQPYNFAVRLLDFQAWKTSTEGWISISSAAQKGYLYKWAYFYYKSGSDWGWYAVNLIDNRVYLTIWDPVNQKYGPWQRQSFNADQVTLNPWSGVWLWSYIDGKLSIPASPTTPFPLGISHRSRLGLERASLALSTELTHHRPPLPSSLPSFPGEGIELRAFEVQAFPNPVTGENDVAFTVQGEEIRDIRVAIYDLSGQQVFESGFVENGFQWNLQNNEGRTVANGVYLYVVRARGFNGEMFTSQVKKLVILR